jgi:YegS/Rv2252/BmrU family lipid kinase
LASSQEPATPAAPFQIPQPASAAVIINPTAGPPRHRIDEASATRLLRAHLRDIQVLRTSRPREASDLAARAGQDHPIVVAVGGDGTVHEVACGLLGSAAALAILPSGSGNDFAFALGIPSPAAGVDALARGRWRWIDVATLDEEPFFNTAGFFLSGLVSGRARRLWRSLGQLRYTLAALWSLATYRPQRATWQLEGMAAPRRERWLLAEVGNGPRAGGGFMLTPDADPSDGRLDFCLIEPVSLLTLARIFPAAARGERFDHAAVYRRQSRSATLALEQPCSIHLDGEPATLSAGEHRIQLQTARLKVLAPDLANAAPADPDE